METAEWIYKMRHTDKDHFSDRDAAIWGSVVISESLWSQARPQKKYITILVLAGAYVLLYVIAWCVIGSMKRKAE